MRFIVFLIIALTVCISAQAPAPSYFGTGTELYHYRITDLSTLYWITPSDIEVP